MAVGAGGPLNRHDETVSIRDGSLDRFPPADATGQPPPLNAGMMVGMIWRLLRR
jgi:hypothetical protein